MLVLSRKVGEQVVIGSDIIITITEAGAGGVRIGIEAPNSVRILRRELVEDWSEQPPAACHIGSQRVPAPVTSPEFTSLAPVLQAPRASAGPSRPRKQSNVLRRLRKVPR
jgi:carbon storage regulator